MSNIIPYYKSSDRAFTILNGDCFDLLGRFDFKFDMIFADPPYFLSNGGISCQAGKVVCVDKGDWDKSRSTEDIQKYNNEWLRLCRDKLKDNGTIWISGTYHNIFSIAMSLSNLGYRILNVVTWAKTNPPPNISRRFFTYSTEFVIWARKQQKVPHQYNYDLMRQINNGRQMKDVWHMPAIGRWEKSCGKHPTQKPLALVLRAILSCTSSNDWILDPFAGSSTTGIAANICGRRYLGIEQEVEYADLGRRRKEELNDTSVLNKYISKLEDLKYYYKGYVSEPENEYGLDLPF